MNRVLLGFLALCCMVSAVDVAADVEEEAHLGKAHLSKSEALASKFLSGVESAPRLRRTALDVGTYFAKGRIIVEIDAKVRLFKKRGFEAALQLGDRQILYDLDLHTSDSSWGADESGENWEFTYFGGELQTNFTLQIAETTSGFLRSRSIETVFVQDLAPHMDRILDGETLTFKNDLDGTSFKQITVKVSYRDLTLEDFEKDTDTGMPFGTTEDELFQQLPRFVSETFSRYYGSIRKDWHQVRRENSDILSEAAGKYAILYVKGFLGNLGMNGRFYARDTLKRFTSLGFDTVKADVHTISSSQQEMKQILNDVTKLAEHTGKQVIVIGHSKGAMDSISMLAEYGEQVEEDGVLAAVIGIQGPLIGSGLDVQGDNITALFKEVTGSVGDEASVVDLSFTERRAFWHMKGGMQSAMKSAPSVKVFTLGSSSEFMDIRGYIWEKGADQFSFLTRLANSLDFVRVIVQRVAYVFRHLTGFKSDGLVNVESTILPRHRNYAAALVAGVDHVEAAVSTPSCLNHNEDVNMAAFLTLLTELMDYPESTTVREGELYEAPLEPLESQDERLGIKVTNFMLHTLADLRIAARNGAQRVQEGWNKMTNWMG